jgi:hypothetical protein
VAGLVLDLRQQDRLALERRGAADPVALGLHADDLGVGVLRDLPDQRLPVGVGHPVPRLDLPVGLDQRVEVPLKLVPTLGHGAVPGRRCPGAAGLGEGALRRGDLLEQVRRPGRPGCRWRAEVLAVHETSVTALRALRQWAVTQPLESMLYC